MTHAYRPTKLGDNSTPNIDKIGDLRLGTSASDGYVLVNGTTTSPQAYPLLAQLTNNWIVSAGNDSTDGEGSGASSPVIGPDGKLYYMKAGAIIQKTANGTGTSGTRSTVATASVNYSSNTRNIAKTKNLMYANGLWYRQYWDSIGNRYLEWATSLAGTWTAITGTLEEVCDIVYSTDFSIWLMATGANGVLKSTDGKAWSAGFDAGNGPYCNLINQGGFCYAFRENGTVLKITSSTTSSLFTTPTNAADGHSVVYHTQSSKFYGIKATSGFTIVSASDPTSAWTVESSTAVASNASRHGCCITNSGIIIMIGNSGTQWSRGNGVWINSTATRGFTSPVFAVDYDTFVHIYDGSGVPLLTGNGSDRCCLPSISSPSFNTSLNFYMKVR